MNSLPSRVKKPRMTSPQTTRAQEKRAVSNVAHFFSILFVTTVKYGSEIWMQFTVDQRDDNGAFNGYDFFERCVKDSSANLAAVSAGLCLFFAPWSFGIKYISKAVYRVRVADKTHMETWIAFIKTQAIVRDLDHTFLS